MGKQQSPIAILFAILASGPLLADPGNSPPAAAQPAGALESIELPAARLDGAMSLEEALAQRHSVRRFDENRLLSLEEIGQLFWAAQGQNRPDRRTAPSAGALYPLEIYAVTREAVYHYHSRTHTATAGRVAGLIDSLWAAADANKHAIRQAPAVFVITGTVSRLMTRYGERAERYVALEAGHAAQNLLLQAVALGLGAVPIGAYRDESIRKVLALPEGETPLYLIPVGHPE
jgi:SagB-type dehydrogenase family enzyme